MSFLTVAPALAALATTANVGPVLIGDRHVRDVGRARDLGFVQANPAGGLDLFRAWRLGRGAIRETRVSAIRSRATETYWFRYLRGWAREGRTEYDAQTDVDAMLRRFRDRTRLGEHLVSAASCSGMDYVDVPNPEGGILPCHHAQISVEVTVEYAITSWALPYGNDHTAASRDSYTAAAAQIEAALARGIEPGDPAKVYAYRPQASPPTDAATAALFHVGIDDRPGHPRTSVWRAYRDSQEEERGTGQRVEHTPGWELNYARSWYDDGGSYVATMAHLDEMRAVLRGVWNLGNPENPTLVKSDPLQVRAVEARKPGGNLCHFVDASLPVRGVVHAAVA